MAENFGYNSGKDDYAARLQAVRRTPVMRFVTMPIGHITPHVSDRNSETAYPLMSRTRRMALMVGTWLIGLADQVPIPGSAVAPANSAEEFESTWCDRLAQRQQDQLFQEDLNKVFAEAMNILNIEDEKRGPQTPPSEL